MPGEWIDFRELRAGLRFEAVLQHYDVEVVRKGEQHQGRCPLPDHGGQGAQPTFSANLERGIFQCFGCKAKGNVLEFAVLMEKVSLQDGRGFRAIALKLQRQFCPDLGHTPARKERPTRSKQAERLAKVDPIINPPLDFELKDLDGAHQSLRDKGLAAETVAHFGLGFCSRGSLKGSLAIPLQDSEGRLLGYASERPEDPGKYHFPEPRKRDEKLIELHRSLFLYHGFQIRGPVPAIIVVRDFASVWWLWQAGFRSVVSTMDAGCSEQQAALLTDSVETSGRVWIVSDGTDSGPVFARSCFERIAPRCFVRLLVLDGGPAKFSPDEIQARFGT